MRLWRSVQIWDHRCHKNNLFSKPKDYIKDIFTKVLQGHIAIATANLNNFFNGKLIDPLARKYLKQIGLDYKHGTGHGVGFFLNVLRGPNRYQNLIR